MVDAVDQQAPPSGAFEALAAARDDYAARNPSSAKAYLDAATSMPGGNTRSVLHFDPFPLYFASGEGACLVDLDGHRYDDFLCEYTAGIFGHSHPRILSALHEASGRGLNFGGSHLEEAKLASLLCGRFPALEMVRFTNSGTEANLLAVGTARVVTGRDKILVFAGGYHGGVLTFGAPSRLNVPFDFLVGRYNDLEGGRAILQQRGGEVAAVLVEPMQQAGGSIPGDPEFLEMLRAETAASGALLIFDEIVTSRLHPGGMHASLGIAPDLVTLGKYIGGGLGFGAFGGRADIMARFDPRRPDALPHAGTFNNNSLTMAVGHVAIAEIFTPEAANDLNIRGELLRGRLNALASAAGAAMQFTGMGSIMGVQMLSGPVRSAEDVRRGDPLLRELFFFHLLAEGIYVARRGMLNLSLVTTGEQVDRLVAAVASFIQKYAVLLRGSSPPKRAI